MTSTDHHPAAWVPARPTITPGPRTLDVDTIRFSQSTISGPTRVQGIEVTLAELVEIYRHQGYLSEPIDVVEMPDGKLTSLDNRRLWAAHQAGLTEIPVIIHDRDEPWGNRAQQDSVRSTSPLIDRDGEFGQSGSLLMDEDQVPDTHLLAALRRCGNQRGHDGARFPLAGSLIPPRFTREKRPPRRSPEEERTVQAWMRHNSRDATSEVSVPQIRPNSSRTRDQTKDSKRGRRRNRRRKGQGGPER